MAKIKYMGTADRATLEKGENFGGRLAEGLPREVVFDVDTNYHVIDSDEAGLSEDAVALLLEDKERFKDVSNLTRIPTSLNEQIFKAMPKSESEQTVVGSASQSTDSDDGDSAGSGGDEQVARGGRKATSGKATTTGGSTT